MKRFYTGYGQTQYYVCIYVNQSNLQWAITLTNPATGSQVSGSGGRLPINIQQYAASATFPPGYTFVSWTGTRGVTIPAPNTTPTAVYFDSSGWDGTCVGNLTVNLQAPISALPNISLQSTTLQIGVPFTVNFKNFTKGGSAIPILDGQPTTLLEYSGWSGISPSSSYSANMLVNAAVSVASHSISFLDGGSAKQSNTVNVTVTSTPPPPPPPNLLTVSVSVSGIGRVCREALITPL